MTTSQPSPGIEARHARPSARPFYVWQFAMWITILHTVLVGTVTVFATMLESHHSLVPCLIVACVMLSPMAIIACSRMSMGRSAWRLLAGYWLAVGAIYSPPLAYVVYESSRYLSVMSLYYFVLYDLGIYLLLGLLLFLPLPVTMLAALLAIERRKRPPDGEAGA
jgi:hypothetical protein